MFQFQFDLLVEQLLNSHKALICISEGDVLGRAYRQVKTHREYGHPIGNDIKSPYNLYKQAQSRASRLERAHKGKVPVTHAIFLDRAYEITDLVSAVKYLLSKSSHEISVSIIKDWQKTKPGASRIVLNGVTDNLLDWYPVDAYTHAFNRETTSKYTYDPLTRNTQRGEFSYDEGIVKVEDVKWKTFSLYISDSDKDENFIMSEFSEAKKILERHGLKQSNDPGQSPVIKPDDDGGDW